MSSRRDTRSASRFLAVAALLSLVWGGCRSSALPVNKPVQHPSLPLPASSVLPVTAPEAAADYPQGFVERKPGLLSLFFDRVPADASSFRVHEAQLEVSKGAWTELGPQDLGEETMQGGASCVSFSGRSYLYFVKASGLKTGGAYFRAEVGERDLGPLEEITVSSPIAILSFPRVRALRDGRIALIFRDFQSRGILALSDDGLDFSAERVVVDEPAAQLGVADFSDGGLAVAYQTDRAGGGKTSWLRLARDDRTGWSAPIQLAPEHINAHDPQLFARLDGALDVYYSATPDRLAGGFLLFRRRVSSQGELGPEQQLTAQGAGSLLMPQIERLPDGGLLLVLARVLGAEGNRSQLAALELSSDAPPASGAALFSETSQEIAERRQP